MEPNESAHGLIHVCELMLRQNGTNLWEPFWNEHPTGIGPAPFGIVPIRSYSTWTTLETSMFSMLWQTIRHMYPAYHMDATDDPPPSRIAAWYRWISMLTDFGTGVASPRWEMMPINDRLAVENGLLAVQSAMMMLWQMNMGVIGHIPALFETFLMAVSLAKTLRTAPELLDTRMIELMLHVVHNAALQLESDIVTILRLNEPKRRGGDDRGTD